MEISRIYDIVRKCIFTSAIAALLVSSLHAFGHPFDIEMDLRHAEEVRKHDVEKNYNEKTGRERTLQEKKDGLWLVEGNSGHCGAQHDNGMRDIEPSYN